MGPFYLTWHGARVVGRFAPLDALGFAAHAVATRRGVDVGLLAADHTAAARVAGELTHLAEIAWCEQVHGSEAVGVEQGGPAGEADALVTGSPGLGLMGFSADCPLVLAADAGSGAVGLAHASWRGTVAGVAARMVERMGELHSAAPERIVACIAPSAGPCCYEVGPDVLDAALKGMGRSANKFFLRRGGALHFDLWGANRHWLLAAGVADANVHVAGVCTLCQNDLFPSYRMEGDAAGRFIAVIGCSEQP